MKTIIINCTTVYSTDMEANKFCLNLVTVSDVRCSAFLWEIQYSSASFLSPGSQMQKYDEVPGRNVAESISIDLGLIRDSLLSRFC